MSKNGYIRKLFNVMRTPRATFELITEKDYKKGVGLILLIALLAGTSRYLYLQKTPLIIPDDLPTGPDGAIDQTSLRQMMRVIGSLAEAFRHIIELPLFAILVFTAGKVTIGGGNIRKFMAQIGLAYTPLLLQQLLRIIYTILTPVLVTQNYFLTNTRTAINQALLTLLDVFNLFWLTTFILTVILFSATFKVNNKKALFYSIIVFTILMIIKTFTFL